MKGHLRKYFFKIVIKFEAYKQKARKLDDYTMETPDGSLTLVNVPFYNGDTFGGAVDFIFESTLA